MPHIIPTDLPDRWRELAADLSPSDPRSAVTLRMCADEIAAWSASYHEDAPTVPAGLDPAVVYRLAADTAVLPVAWWVQPINDPAAEPVELVASGPDPIDVDLPPDAAREHRLLVELVRLIRAGNTAAAVVRLERLAGVDS